VSRTTKEQREIVFKETFWFPLVSLVLEDLADAERERDEAKERLAKMTMANDELYDCGIRYQEQIRVLQANIEIARKEIANASS
jgi:hypothetical protein